MACHHEPLVTAEQPRLVVKSLQTQRMRPRLWSFWKLETGTAGPPRQSIELGSCSHTSTKDPCSCGCLCAQWRSLLAPSEYFTFVVWQASVVTGYTESQDVMRLDNTVQDPESGPDRDRQSLVLFLVGFSWATFSHTHPGP